MNDGAKNRFIPFDPATEIREGHYVYDRELKFGKLSRLYFERRLDISGNIATIISFPENYIKSIGLCLPEGCFIASPEQMIKFNDRCLGKGWNRIPSKAVLDLYGFSFDGVYEKRYFPGMDESILFATSRHTMYLMCDRHRGSTTATMSSCAFNCEGQLCTTLVPISFSLSYIKRVEKTMINRRDGYYYDDFNNRPLFLPYDTQVPYGCISFR